MMANLTSALVTLFLAFFAFPTLAVEFKSVRYETSYADMIDHHRRPCTGFTPKTLGRNPNEGKPNFLSIEELSGIFANVPLEKRYGAAINYLGRVEDLFGDYARKQELTIQQVRILVWEDLAIEMNRLSRDQKNPWDCMRFEGPNGVIAYTGSNTPYPTLFFYPTDSIGDSPVVGSKVFSLDVLTQDDDYSPVIWCGTKPLLFKECPILF